MYHNTILLFLWKATPWNVNVDVKGVTDSIQLGIAASVSLMDYIKKIGLKEAFYFQKLYILCFVSAQGSVDF